MTVIDVKFEIYPFLLFIIASPANFKAMGKMKRRPEMSKLKDYLIKGALAEEMTLDKLGHISFHWSNSEKAVEFLRSQQASAQGLERWESLQAELSYFKESPVWMRGPRGSLKTTLYHLYECYLDPRLRQHWHERDREYVVSLQNEAGPYITLSSMKWFDSSIYSKFVYLKLIDRKMPVRKFRLNMHMPFSFFWKGNPLSAISGHVHQVAKDGILLKLDHMGTARNWCDGEVFFHKKMEEIGPALNKSSLFSSEIIEEALPEFSVEAKYLSQSLNELSLTHNDQNLFIFISWDKMNFNGQSKHTGKLSLSPKERMEEVERQFLYELNKVA
jgi:hypothetical protein